jgi:3-hydroxybutyryl-CoA dehydrogenase
MPLPAAIAPMPQNKPIHSDPLPPTSAVAVIGCGTMGSGIAQVAVSAGHTVYVFDARAGAAATARKDIGVQLTMLAGKGKITAEAADNAVNRIILVDSLEETAAAGLAIEAIQEDLGIKRELFAKLEAILGEDAILATNTSSLSVTSMAAGLRRPGNICGMHFFNPAALMPLVEIVTGLDTKTEVADCLTATVTAWGKIAVRARSTPGFIVNRVARPFYGEGLRVLQERAADPATLDAVIRDCGAFRMGPFEVMDMIGHDVNFAVTSSIHASLYGDPRFTPSIVQRELVDAGRLGRKSGRGFYDYTPGARPQLPHEMPAMAAPKAIQAGADPGPAGSILELARAKGLSVGQGSARGSFLVDGVVVALTNGSSATIRAAAEGIRNLVTFDLARDYLTCPRIALAVADQADPKAINTAAGFFQALGKTVTCLNDVPGMIVARTVAMLVNEAADSVMTGIAYPGDIDMAMVKGTGYPVGPLKWADDLGSEFFLGILERLQESYCEDRYRPSQLLRRMAATGSRFH